MEQLKNTAEPSPFQNVIDWKREPTTTRGTPEAEIRVFTWLT
jgi:hypothetical protein